MDKFTIKEQATEITVMRDVFRGPAGPQGERGIPGPDDYVLVQDEQPTSESNRIWVDPSDETEVVLATWEDVLKLYPTDTASDEIASFPDGADGVPVKSLTINVEPVQAGSGDPSPDNVRPISGRTSATIYHSGADTSDPTTCTITLGDTVYGGQLDVTQGKMVVDRAMVDLGTLEYFFVSSGSVNAFRSNIGARPVTNNSQHGITSIYPFAGTRFTSNMPNLSWMIDSQGRLFIRDDRYTDISSFVAYLSGQTIVYELATSIEITLAPTQIETLLGTNNIWSDAGPVDVNYRADIGLYINKKITEAQGGD